MHLMRIAAPLEPSSFQCGPFFKSSVICLIEMNAERTRDPDYYEIKYTYHSFSDDVKPTEVAFTTPYRGLATVCNIFFVFWKNIGFISVKPDCVRCRGWFAVFGKLQVLFINGVAFGVVYEARIRAVISYLGTEYRSVEMLKYFTRSQCVCPCEWLLYLGEWQ